MYNYTAVTGPNKLQFQVATRNLYDWVVSHFKAWDSSNIAASENGATITITIQDGYGEPYDNQPPTIIDEGSSITYMRSDYKLVSSEHHCHADIQVYDELGIKHALINLYSSFLIHRREGLLVHSSCVMENGKAWMFAGPSGAGKSTVVELSEPRPVLSDEATYLHLEADGSITVWDSPFRSEMDTPCSFPSCKLSGILFLNQSLEVYTTPISKGDALIQLMDKVFYWSYSRLETANMMALSRAVVDRAAAYQLYFQKNNTFWERIS